MYTYKIKKEKLIVMHTQKFNDCLTRRYEEKHGASLIKLNVKEIEGGKI